MTKSACVRRWEVEAVRDGRLGDVARASTEGHVARCRDCASYARSLERLAAALREAPPPPHDELARRRARYRLLERAQQALLDSTPRHRRRWLAPAAIATVAAAAVIVISSPRGHGTFFEPAPPAPLDVRVDPAAGASWARDHGERVETIHLDDGQLALHVRRSSPNTRLLVITPDGQLEDVGTTFSVTVASARTRTVKVDEGEVVLRLVGHAPVSLTAGMTWSASPEPAPLGPEGSAHGLASAPPAVATDVPGNDQARPRGAPLASTVSREPAPEAAIAVSNRPHAAVPADDPSAAPSRPASVATSPSAAANAEGEAAEAFRDAMTAYRRGAFADAARRFRQYDARFGAHGRAEDAAYMRLLSLSRLGDTPATTRAAREFLARFPHGFRAREARRLADVDTQ